MRRRRKRSPVAHPTDAERPVDPSLVVLGIEDGRQERWEGAFLDEFRVHK